MTFLAPWLLLGTLLGALPVVIHLLNKPRYRREVWGAMRFLQTAITQRSRTIRIQNWLLMLLRVLILVFFALALARPVLRAVNIGAGGQPATIVMIFDGSYSMRQGEHRDNAFSKAKESALKLVDGMKEQDNALIVWAGNKPRAITPRPVYNKTELRRIIEQLDPGWEDADIPRAVEYSTWMLDSSTLPRHRIVIFSDGRTGAWPLDDAAKWEKANKVYEEHKLPLHLYGLIDPPEEAVRNMTVSDLRPRYPLLDIHREATLVAEIDNHTGEKQSVELVLNIDNEEVEVRPVTLREGRHTETFTYKFESPGSHSVSLLLLDDDLPVDNRRDLAVEVLEQIPVLLVEGGNSPDPFTSDGTLLSWALEAGATERQRGLFAVDVLHQTEFNQLMQNDLIKYKSVIFANVSSLSSESARIVDQYVRNGGGVLIGLGSRVDAAAWNRFELGTDGLMPANIRTIQNAEGKPWRPVFPAGVALDALGLFDVARTRTLGDVRIETLYSVKPVEGTLTAGLVEENPLLLIKRHEEGAAALWTSSLGLEWNNIAAVPDYVPLMQNLVFYLSSSVVPPINLNQGETLVYSWSRAAAMDPSSTTNAATHQAPDDCLLIPPDGQKEELSLTARMGERIAFHGDTLAPGFYRVQAEGVPERIYAVTLPRDAGKLDPVEINGDSMKIQHAPLQLTTGMEALDQAIRTETGVRDIATLLAILALALLLAEMILGWRAAE